MNTTPDPVDPLDVDLQAEIDAALGHASLEDLVFEETPQATGGKRPRRDGIVVAVRDREALIEFGPKLQGVCPVDQFDEPPTVGARDTFIIDREDLGYRFRLMERDCDDPNCHRCYVRGGYAFKWVGRGPARPSSGTRRLRQQIFGSDG